MASKYDLGEVATVSQTCETVQDVRDEPHHPPEFDLKVLVVMKLKTSNLTNPGISQQLYRDLEPLTSTKCKGVMLIVYHSCFHQLPAKHYIQ